MAIDISAQTRRVVYTGSAGTGPYAYAFNILVNTDIAVFYNTIELTLTTDYTVAIGAAGTGAVTLVVNSGGNIPSTPSSSDRVTLLGDRTIQRTSDFTTGGPLFATTLNNEFDSLTIFTQQNLEQSNRSLRAPNTDPTTVNMELPLNTVRANKYLTFDVAGNPVAQNAVGTYRGNWAASTAYVLQDIVKDTSTNNIFIVITAHTSSGSQPLTTNTDAAKWSLVVDAASASASAAAAVVAKDAAIVAKNESVTAKNLSVTAKNESVTAKDLSVTAKNEAVTAKNEAVTAKNASASSATAAAATKLDFDKKYLGAYADGSIPSTGPGGTALVTGALYFNTSSNQIFVWTSGDAWIAIKPTSTEQTAITAVAADATDIGAVAGKATEIGRLGTSAAVADLALLGTTAIVADMALLASTAVIADMAILGSDVVIADMAILATAPIVADMAILGTTDVVNDMNVLGTSAVVADMNLLGTSANVTNMAAIGASGVITNIATVSNNVAGVNSFADLYRGALSSNPGGTITQGSLYYNTNSPKQLKIYNGSAWVEAAFSADGAVSSFNGRNGSVTLTSADVVGALATGAIATAKIANDAITADKLANSINSAITANTAKTGITSGQTSAITANTAKVTNATHSGEVTGATALTIANNIVDEANLKVSNNPTNGYFLSAQSGDAGGLTWAVAGGGSSFASDITVNGITVGKGANSVSTNTVLGDNALDANTSGSLNTAVGFNALTANLGGSQNVAVGRNAAAATTTAVANTAIGTSALSGAITTGGGTAVGGDSLKITTGTNNTAIGYGAGQTLTTGTNNTLIGYAAAPSTVAVSNEITLGNSSVTSVRMGNGTLLNGGVTHLGTMTTTSGTSQSITGLNFTNLNLLIFVVAQVSHSDTGGSRKLAIGIAGGPTQSIGDAVAAGNCLIGHYTFDLRSNIGHFAQSPGNAPISSGYSFVGGGTGHSRYNIGANLRASSSTSVSCDFAAGATFDFGKIEVYGCK